MTGGSNSTRAFWARYRLVAARARARLVAAAAESWGVPTVEIRVDSSVISHPGGTRATFGELAAMAEKMPIPDGVQPKDPSAYRVLGREGRLRVDTPGKILGTTQFTIDVSLPGMLTAIVLHPPRFGGKIASVDDHAALAEPGVRAVIPIGEGVAVVAETAPERADRARAHDQTGQFTGREHERVGESENRVAAITVAACDAPALVAALAAAALLTGPAIAEQLDQPGAQRNLVS